MNRLLVSLIGCGAIAAVSAPSHGAYVIAGAFQTEQGDAGDWDPSGSSLVMSEAGGVHTYTVVNLTDGVAYEFKVLNDEGNPPATWGSPQVTPNNIKLFGDADGSATITVDDNVLNNQGNPVIWVNFDGGPLQVVGDFMDEAGGGGDWNPSDPTFGMTSHSGGYYTFDAVISTPGTYEFKITDGTGWDYQIGVDGFANNTNTFQFSTSSSNEAVTLFADLASGSIGVVPEPASLALLGVGGLLVASRRRGV